MDYEYLLFNKIIPQNNLSNMSTLLQEQTDFLIGYFTFQTNKTKIFEFIQKLPLSIEKKYYKQRYLTLSKESQNISTNDIFNLWCYLMDLNDKTLFDQYLSTIHKCIESEYCNYMSCVYFLKPRGVY